MSLKSKRALISSIDKIKRQSFSERICDDLSEVILQFLPFDDKFRLECVSKQFQRTIFVKVLAFTIHWSNVLEVYIVLKKCPNIESLSFGGCYADYRDNRREYNLMIDLINKYCNHLKKIHCHLDLMNDTNNDMVLKNTRQKFIDTFGSKLKSPPTHEFYIFGSKYPDIVKPFVNIEELVLTVKNWNLRDSKIKFNKLRKLEVHFCDKYTKTYNIKVFPTFIANHPLITDLEVYYNEKYDLNSILGIISTLKNLTRLKIHEIDGKLSTRLVQKPELKSGLKQIANNCPKLKTICCDICIDADTNPQLKGLLSSVLIFKRIKRLDLFIAINKLNDINSFSFKLFKGFHELTHLSLSFFVYLIEKDRFDFPDTILAGIDITLPQLKYLRIYMGGKKLIATELTHNILSRLSSLHTIKIDIRNKKMEKIIKTKLTEHKKYRTIELNLWS